MPKLSRSRNTKATSRIIDNPLLQPTMDRPLRMKSAIEPEAEPAVDEKPAVTLPLGEKTDVGEMVEDLHKQLSDAFDIGDARNEERIRLKKRLAQAGEHAEELDARMQELKEMLSVRDDSESGLRSLKGLQEQVRQREAAISDLQEKVAQLTLKLSEKDAHIEQLVSDFNLAVADKEKHKSELERVKKNIDEIRLLLAERVAMAWKPYRTKTYRLQK
ncbi:MAG: hypothetical protein MJA29_04590 [Candidatus Omnitrophica bacterium]|nr:hypothetical protein [Candidatus Omnitrophota bacterium]